MAGDRLFDASSVIDVLLGEEGTITHLFDEYTLELTRYEAGNALWKIDAARDDLPDDELREATALLDRVLEEMVLADTTDGTRTMGVALEEGLTFYDASYLAVAERESLALVTEDGALGEAAAGRGIATESVRESE